ncbi:hypothetical protein Tco_1016138 [Tanacetum coccineum]|uniref:Uncharacterized protein n=1 Tax=Tanacetum coccineum TaxID=301880 RepID=A0ABQ5FNZ1_9ASTR
MTPPPPPNSRHSHQPPPSSPSSRHHYRDHQHHRHHAITTSQLSSPLTPRHHQHHIVTTLSVPPPPSQHHKGALGFNKPTRVCLVVKTPSRVRLVVINTEWVRLDLGLAPLRVRLVILSTVRVRLVGKIALRVRLAVQKTTRVSVVDAKLDTNKSPYDTESEIKVVKRFHLPYTNDEVQIIFLGSVHDEIVEEPANSYLHPIPDDDVVSVFGFEASKSFNGESDKAETKVELSQSKKVAADNILDEMTTLNAFADQLSDTLKVTDKLKESIPRMVADTFEEQMPELISNTLKNILPQILIALNTLESQRFEILQKELLKAIRAKVGKELIKLMKDMVHLLESASVFHKANVEGEKWEKANLETTEAKL